MPIKTNRLAFVAVCIAGSACQISSVGAGGDSTSGGITTGNTGSSTGGTSGTGTTSGGGSTAPGAQFSPQNSSFFADPGTVVADGISASSLTVVVNDANDQPMPGQVVQFTATGTFNVLNPNSGRTNASGAFTTSMTSTKAESKVVSVSVGAASLATSVVFEVGRPSIVTSTMAANPNTQVADGNSPVALIVTLLDSGGNPVANQTVTLSSTGTNNQLIPSSGPTDANGAFLASMLSTAAETKTVTATFAGASLQVSVVFSPPAATTGGGSTAGGSTAGTSTGGVQCNLPYPCYCDPGCVSEAFGIPPDVGGATGGSSSGGGTVATSTAGGCAGPVCQYQTTGGGVGLPEPDPNSGVYRDPNTGWITLPTSDSNNSALAHQFAWILNTIESTASLVDTRLGVEVGRYASVWIDPNTVSPTYLQNNPLHGANPTLVPDYTTQCPLPSHTAVDPSNNALYLANTSNADDNWTYPSPCEIVVINGDTSTSETKYPNWDQGTVTKIGRYDDSQCNSVSNPGLVGCACRDRNGDGFITTSHDVNGDGEIYTGTCKSASNSCSVTCTADLDCANPNSNAGYATARYCYVPFGATSGNCSIQPHEFWGNNDECLLWTSLMPRPAGTNPGDYNGPKPRGMDVDPNGWLWVGDSRTNTGRNGILYKFDPWSGALLNPNVVLPKYQDTLGPNLGSSNPAASLASSAVVASPTQTVGINLMSYYTSHGGSNGSIMLYGAVIDRTGLISTVSRDGAVVQVDAFSGQINPQGYTTQLNANDTYGGYGITFDSSNRLWVPVWGNETQAIPRIRVFDQVAQTWSLYPDQSNPGTLAKFTDPNTFGQGYWAGRGATASVVTDPNGGAPHEYVWAVYNYSGSTGTTALITAPNSWLIEFDDATGQMLQAIRSDQYTDPNGVVQQIPCQTPIGVGIGADNSVWVVAQGSNTVCGYNPGTGDWTVVNVGSGPYTYSDFTGNIFRQFTAGVSTYTMTFSGCNSSNYEVSSWDQLILSALVPGDPNASATIAVAVQVAPSPPDFATGSWQPLSPPFTDASSAPSVYDLSSLPVGSGAGYLQVQFTLNRGTDANATFVPTIQGVDVMRHCVPLE